jgi:hypothetical protein
MYGIWLVYNKDEFPTEHIGHFTITCYMEKEDAIKLYQELLSVYGKYHEIYVRCIDPVRFDDKMYENDNNDLYSWGYEGHILENGMATDLWSDIEKIANKYRCDFSYRIHTSMAYSRVKQNSLQLFSVGGNKTVKCSMELVDITSDKPMDWHIITPE